MSSPSPHMVDFPTFVAPNGSLTVIESGLNGLLQIRRAYYLHNLTPDAERGGHAHRTISQWMLAISGSFVVRLERGSENYEFYLDSPTEGLFIPPMTWRTLSEFSQESVCLVLASENYDEAEYIRDYAEFSEFSKSLEMP